MENSWYRVFFRSGVYEDVYCLDFENKKLAIRQLKEKYDINDEIDNVESVELIDKDPTFLFRIHG